MRDGRRDGEMKTGERRTKERDEVGGEKQQWSRWERKILYLCARRQLLVAVPF